MKIRVNSDWDSEGMVFWFLPSVFLLVSKTEVVIDMSWLAWSLEIVFVEGKDR